MMAHDINVSSLDRQQEDKLIRMSEAREVIKVTCFEHSHENTTHIRIDKNLQSGFSCGEFDLISFFSKEAYFIEFAFK